MDNKKYYKPLPDNLTIINSPIDGLGLFAVEDIKADTCLGLSHIHNISYKDEYIRTPLGGFINYNEDPNCETSKTYAGQETNDDSNNLYLWSLRNIKRGEELTLKYRLYNPTE